MGCESSVSTEGPKKTVPLRHNVRDLYTIGNLVTFNATSGLFTSASRTAEKKASFWIRFAGHNSKAESREIVDKKLDLISSYQALLPCLVPYVVFGQSPSHYYMVMEQWDNAVPILNAVANGKFELNEPNLCGALTGLFFTLAKMHEKKLVHGQISPSKILLREGRFYLFDLAIGLESSVDLLTENCCYLAPEVLDGESPTPASDVWALGASIYHIVTGHTIYPVSSQSEHVRLALSQEPFFGDPAWRQLSEGFVALIQRMLVKDKAGRPKMREVAEADCILKQGLAKGPTVDGATTHGGPLPVYKETIELEISQRNSLTRAIGLLAAEKTKKGLNEVKRQLTELDFMKNGLVELRFLMGKVLMEGHEFLREIGESTQQVYYAYTLDNAIALNQLILGEKHSFLFHKLSHGRERLSDEEIKGLMNKCGHSSVVPDVKKFNATIREHQKEKREGLDLTCEEFIRLLDTWDYNLPDELICQYME